MTQLVVNMWAEVAGLPGMVACKDILCGLAATQQSGIDLTSALSGQS